MPAPQLIYATNKLEITGSWTTCYLRSCVKLYQSWQTKQHTSISLSLNNLDTNGAVALLKIIGQEPANWPTGLTSTQLQLLHLVIANPTPAQPIPKRQNWLEKLGREVMGLGAQTQYFFNFVGQSVFALACILKKPQRFKVKLWLDVLQKDGLYALPLVSVLAFLLGAVVAWQGGLQLKNYGANIFIVELVALTHLRELGPLITAILVAGRSGSAYAAQLATMQINQEVLALRSLGQDPFDWLVTPKVLGLIVALPLLTLVADLAGLVGGSLVAQMQLDINPTLFWQRLGQEVNIVNFYIGIIKAPIFALIIVNVGCLQGMLAKGGADAVGQRTTRSVVQAIFLVIITDAIFSIVFSGVS